MIPSFKPFYFLAATAFLAVSCTDYSPYEGSTKDLEYAKNFKDKFGKIDPEQDWSMATYAKAYVSGMEDGVIELLYSDPIAGTPVLIAKRPIVNGEAEFNFNIVKGTKRVFARIKDANGNYSLNRYFEVFDNELYIAKEGTTRAGGINFTGTSRVTKESASTLDCPQLIDWTKSSEFYLKTDEMLAADAYIDGYYADNTHNQNITGKNEFFHTGTFTNIYWLNDVISTTDERPWWYVSEIAPFFSSIDGQPACFDEAVNHIVLMKEGANPKLAKDLVFEITEAGPFYLDYFFEGTDYVNDFGYFYFTGDNPTREQFMTMPKFVMVNDFAHNTTEQTRINATTEVPWNLLGMQGNYNGSTPGTGLAGIDFSQSNWDSKVVGTRLPLTYFGSDGTNATGTYEFPVGTKIGIFFIGRSNNRDNMIITSISKLNQDLYNETPHAASFQIGDKVVFAMEDMYCGGDKDINDAMFIAHGKFNKTYIPNIIPTVEPESQTWMMACEDLGGSFDYDFNDLVFGLRVTDLGDNTSNLDLIPLAAGGTLDAKIEYNGTIVGEIHNLVKPGAPTTTPINVTAGETPVKGQAVRLESGIASSTNINTIASQVKIIVTKGETTTNNVEEGNNVYNIGYDKTESHIAPQVLLLPSGWDWPSEETLITKIYPQFENWVANAKDPDSQTWCQTKAQNATALVTNPVPAVTPSTDPENPTPGEGGGETPVTPGTDEWNITIAGEPVMGMGTSQTITIAVDGLEDYTNVECGTYSTNVIMATKIDNTHYSIAGATAQARGVARFYVKVPADATHATTRKVFEITVGAAVPEFYFYTTANNENIRITSGALTLPVKPTDAGVELYIEAIDKKADGGAITWHSSDEDVVKVVNNQLQRVACGTVTITATHAAVDNVNASFSELSKSIELTIERLDPEFTISPASIQIGERETKAFSISETKGQNSYTKWIDNEEFAIVTTLNGGDAVKGIAKGNAKLYVKHNQTQWYKELTKSIDVTVSESLLPAWEINVANTVPTKMTIGDNFTSTLGVTGESNIGDLSYAVGDNGVLSYTSGYGTFTINALKEGTGTFSITYPGNDVDHKTTTISYTIEVEAPDYGTEISGATITKDGSGNYSASLPISELSTAVASGAVSILAVGEVNPSYWYGEMQYYGKHPEYGYDGWLTIGTQGAKTNTSLSIDLTADEYAKLLSSGLNQETTVKLYTRGVTITNVYITSK